MTTYTTILETVSETIKGHGYTINYDNNLLCREVIKNNKRIDYQEWYSEMVFNLRKINDKIEIES